MHAQHLILSLLTCALGLCGCGSDSSGVGPGTGDTGADASNVIQDAGNLDADITSCPTSCVAPENAQLDCPSGTCGFVCDEGWHPEGQACLPDLATCAPGAPGQRVAIPSVESVHTERAILGIALSGSKLGVSFTENSNQAYLGHFDYPSLVHAGTSEPFAFRAKGIPHRSMHAVPTGFLSTYYTFSADFGPRTWSVHHDFNGAKQADSLLGSSVYFEGLVASNEGFGLLYNSLNTFVGLRRTDHALERLDGSDTDLTYQNFRAPTSVATSLGEPGYRVLGQAGYAQLASAHVSLEGEPSPIVMAFDVLPGGIRTLEPRDGPFLSGMNQGYAVLVHTRGTGVGEWHLGVLDSDGEAIGSLQNIEAAEEAPEVILATGPDSLALAYMTSERELRVDTFTSQGVLLQSDSISTGLVELAPYFDITWAGDRYVVAWARQGSGSERMFLRTVCTE